MKTANMEVALLGHFGNDDVVANAARVSFHKDASNYTEEQNGKLLKYLAAHKHHSPFNHCFLSFRVKAPIFVARQLVKHKFMPWNEVSRRYVDEEPEFYIPEWRNRADNVKQGSGDKYDDVIWTCSAFGNVGSTVTGEVEEQTENALWIYKDMLQRGVCPEQARVILPQNTMTEWVWSGTLGAFLDMLVLRLDPHTQLETREVAQKIATWVEYLFPVSYKAYIE